MDTIYKTYRAVVKAVDEAEGTIDMLIPMSTGAKDRVNEVILPEAFRKTLRDFRKRPVLLSSHNYNDLRKQIGEFTSIKLGEDGLLAKPKYYVNEGNEEADWGFKLAQKGMAAFSVGFIPITTKEAEKDTDPLRTYEEVELLEISQVCVPANREAIQGVRAKSVDSVLNDLLDEILNAPIVDLTGEPDDAVTKPEETDEYYRVPVPKEEGKHSGHKIRTIDVSTGKGIKGLYCIDDKVIITYLFVKSKWGGMKECQDWVAEHEKGITQAELADEMDYLLRQLQGVKSLLDENMMIGLALIVELRRITGGDIPDEDNSLIDWAKAKEPDLLVWAKSL